jgi:hypothetical protein
MSSERLARSEFAPLRCRIWQARVGTGTRVLQGFVASNQIVTHTFVSTRVQPELCVYEVCTKETYLSGRHVFHATHFPRQFTNCQRSDQNPAREQ